LFHLCALLARPSGLKTAHKRIGKCHAAAG
jgi:hypothetical protein